MALCTGYSRVLTGVLPGTHGGTPGYSQGTVHRRSRYVATSGRGRAVSRSVRRPAPLLRGVPQAGRGTLQYSRGQARVGVGLRHARRTRFGACAAPTPAPTNAGDTNPPTRAPTTFAPTRAPTLSPTFPGGARQHPPTSPLFTPHSHSHVKPSSDTAALPFEMALMNPSPLRAAARPTHARAGGSRGRYHRTTAVCCMFTLHVAMRSVAWFFMLHVASGLLHDSCCAGCNAVRCNAARCACRPLQCRPLCMMSVACCPLCVLHVASYLLCVLHAAG
jgi:hypothetical protein